VTVQDSQGDFRSSLVSREMKFVGANGASLISEADQLPCIVDDFIGIDSKNSSPFGFISIHESLGMTQKMP